MLANLTSTHREQETRENTTLNQEKALGILSFVTIQRKLLIFSGCTPGCYEEKLAKVYLYLGRR